MKTAFIIMVNDYPEYVVTDKDKIPTILKEVKKNIVNSIPIQGAYTFEMLNTQL